MYFTREIKKLFFKSFEYKDIINVDEPIPVRRQNIRNIKKNWWQLNCQVAFWGLQEALVLYVSGKKRVQ